MAMKESSISMTDLDKKSTDDLGDRLSIDNEADEEGVLPGDSHVRGSGMFGTTMNLVNTIIGSGVLALPSCAAKTGWLLAVILMVVGAGITWTGLWCLAAVGHKMGGDKTSFGAAAARTYPWMIVLVDFCVFAVTYGICIAYMTIAASILPAVVKMFAPTLSPDHIILKSWLWLIICWGVFAFPLSMLKTVKVLGYTSAAAVACVLYTTVIVVGFAVGLFDPCDKPIPEGKTCVGEIQAFGTKFNEILLSVPVYLTAFCCAPSMFNVYNDLKAPSTKRLNLSSLITMGLCTGLYMIIALAGYFTYGTNVAGNILDSFPVDVWATVARLGTAFVVTVSYPLLMHPARDSVVHAINVCAGGKFTNSNMLFYTVALVLNITAFFGALLNVPLDLILSITGSIGVVNLSLTIPYVLYYKMFEDEDTPIRKIMLPAAAVGVGLSIVTAVFSIGPLFGMFA